MIEVPACLVWTTHWTIEEEWTRIRRALTEVHGPSQASSILATGRPPISRPIYSIRVQGRNSYVLQSHRTEQVLTVTWGQEETIISRVATMPDSTIRTRLRFDHEFLSKLVVQGKQEAEMHFQSENIDYVLGTLAGE